MNTINGSTSNTMNITDVAKPTALQIAADIKAGERSAREVVQETLDAIAETNGEINAFLTVMSESALESADRVDADIAAGKETGPLAGVPVALKDNLCTRGVPTTCSSKMLDGWLPPYSATVVERLSQAGAIAVGKTNLDEFAMGSSTENSAFGPTLNPHDTERVPGGSSGGSAAAVAAHMVPLSLGSDTGGSIRQPASLCGVVGVKPSYGAVSRYGMIAFASSLDQIGPFANSVADAAACFDAISGHDHRDATSVPVELISTLDSLDRGVEGLRVGIIEELCGEGIDADVLARVEAAGVALEAAGASVERVSIPATIYGLGAYYMIAPAEASSNLARFDGVRYGNRVSGADVAAMNTATRTQGFGDEVKRRIMLGTYALSSGYHDAYYGKAQRVRRLIAQEFAQTYENFDVLLAPASPSEAFKFGDKTDPMALYMCDVTTIPSNLAGHPAMSVPFGVGDEGLPIGVQILAPMLKDHVMFQTAAVLEAAQKSAGGQ